MPSGKCEHASVEFEPMKPMQTGANEPAGADLWRQPLDYEDRQYFSGAGVSIEAELGEFCSAAIPLQWFAQADFERQRCAAVVARSLAERELGEDEKQRAGTTDQSAVEWKARREEELQRRTLHFFAPLLALILFRTARCAREPQATWNSPLAASLRFGRLLDLVRPAGESAGDMYDSLFVYFATAVEMGSLPLQNDEEPREAPCFRNAILLWAKYAESILRTLTARGLRLNGATVRECTTVQQAVGCLMLGVHPSSIVAALCASGNNEVDFLRPFARACVAYHVSPGDAYQQGSDAAGDGSVPDIANRYDDLLAPPSAPDDSPPPPDAP